MKLLPACLATLSSCTSPATEEGSYEASPEELERWMAAWMSTNKAVGGALHLTRFKDPIYVLTKDIEWTPNPGQEAYAAVTVPKGFVTDFASIPRIFWKQLRPDGEYTYPAILHDYLYWTQQRSRQEADEIFDFAMEDLEIGGLTRAAIYNAVRIFGDGSWDENARLRTAGERRVLQKFPQEPKITWAEWKDKEGVFL